mmetsp:Transcript_31059/g.82332  ORF Transcript_31059/g.82332 Transcript_31059/m.82332 type:complete len:206 (-) Transcript_31059:20-637(-)
MHNQRRSSSNDKDHHMATEQLCDPLIPDASRTDSQREAGVAEDVRHNTSITNRTADTAACSRNSTQAPDPGLRRPSPVETLDFDEPYNSLYDEELLDTSPGEAEFISINVNSNEHARPVTTKTHTKRKHRVRTGVHRACIRGHRISHSYDPNNTTTQETMLWVERYKWLVAATIAVAVAVVGSGVTIGIAALHSAKLSVTEAALR